MRELFFYGFITYPFIYLMYINRITILMNVNFYVLKMIEYVNKYNQFSIKIEKTEQIENNMYYTYNYDNRKFISFDENIEIDDKEYIKFSQSLQIPNSPDNILSAVIKNNLDNKEIDVLESIQKLCGPFVNQINHTNKDLIIKYLKSKYNFTIEKDMILEIFIMKTKVSMEILWRNIKKLCRLA